MDDDILIYAGIVRNGVGLVIDSETGVHYLMSLGQVNSLCPRYRADGSLMTSDQRTIALLKAKRARGAVQAI